MGPAKKELGTQKHIPASTIKQKISEMDRLSIPKEGIYISSIWLQKQLIGIYTGTENIFSDGVVNDRVITRVDYLLLHS